MRVGEHDWTETEKQKKRGRHVDGKREPGKLSWLREKWSS